MTVLLGNVDPARSRRRGLDWGSAGGLEERGFSPEWDPHRKVSAGGVLASPEWGCGEERARRPRRGSRPPSVPAGVGLPKCPEDLTHHPLAQPPCLREETQGSHLHARVLVTWHL